MSDLVIVSSNAVLYQLSDLLLEVLHFISPLFRDIIRVDVSSNEPK